MPILTYDGRQYLGDARSNRLTPPTGYTNFVQLAACRLRLDYILHLNEVTFQLCSLLSLSPVLTLSHILWLLSDNVVARGRNSRCSVVAYHVSRQGGNSQTMIGISWRYVLSSYAF